jgi:hypothetical protein
MKRQYVIFICCGIAVAFLVIFNKYRQNQLARDFLIANGAEITSYDLHRSANGYTLAYTFIAGANTYKGETSVAGLTKDPSSFIGKHVPVVYVPDHPGNNRLALTPKDFEDRHKTFPDSLNWVLPHLATTPLPPAAAH